MLALYFGGMGARGRNYYNDVLRRYGYEREADEIQDLYLGGRKKEAAALVPADCVAGMNLIGDVGYVKERVAAYREQRRHRPQRPAGRAQRASGHRDPGRLIA